MQVHVRFRLNDDREIVLLPGAVIGRTPTAALRLNDPAVSEAHAFVSLRGSDLHLLSLRGRFTVGDRRVSDVVLTPGAIFHLAPNIRLEVLEVTLPSFVLALAGEGLAQLVPPPVASLYATADPIVPGFSESADAILWSGDDVFHLRVRGAPDRVLDVGDAFAVGPRPWRVVAAPLAAAAVAATAADPAFGVPMTLVVRYDTVHIWRGGDAAAIDGVPARIMTELALAGVPVEWRTAAGEIWPAEVDDARLRMSWDAGLARLRRRLRELRIRADLVRTDGGGRAELFLGPDDRVEDAT